MKCLPTCKIPRSNGVGVHDWHAEILAVRAFNQFLLEECRLLARGHPSLYLRWRPDTERSIEEDGSWHGQPFGWKEEISLHMYCSEAPCGDASMELIMAAQDDASPWDVPSAADGAPDTTPAEQALPGRAYFSQLGVVRRKPARGDAPPTMSKSCSDKLALRQCISLLSAVTALLVAPDNVYLRSVIVPESQYLPVSWRRCFGIQGRMHELAGRVWLGGYRFSPFTVETTRREFRYSVREVKKETSSVAASNLAAVWSLHGLQEGLIGGVLQGRKQFDRKGASLVSRRRLWECAREIATSLESVFSGLRDQLHARTYHDLKNGPFLKARREVKQEVYTKSLRVWISNIRDDDFALE
ncbi:hypothetical protein VTK73DRAFT_9351 [Phialemonium thermophilum]|uniref:A to I editase domain-containing protein n=1 Tax=Phialemonium thermophilum TaxID=223376 RepID=A0ABR3XLI0_9PEZI